MDVAWACSDYQGQAVCVRVAQSWYCCITSAISWFLSPLVCKCCLVKWKLWAGGGDVSLQTELPTHICSVTSSCCTTHSFPLQGPADTAERWSRPWPAVSSLNWGNHLSILCTSSDCIAFRRKSNKLFHSTLPHIIYVEIRIAIVTAINQRLVQHDFLIL